MANVALCIASHDSPRWPFVDSLMNLDKGPHQLIWLREGPFAVDTARNLVVERALKTEAEWIWMVDSDATFHPLTLRRLLSHKVDAVGALSFQRYGPVFPTVMKGKNPSGDGYGIQVGVIRKWILEHPQFLTSKPVILVPRPEDALFQVDRTGCHCLLVHRSVYESISPPWFKGDPERKHTREDMYFCSLLEEQGIPLYVDLSVSTGHLYGDREASTLDFLVWDLSSDYGSSQRAEEDPEPSFSQKE